MTSRRRAGPYRMVALWCWYRGAGFHGYQQQLGHRTVQGELLRAYEAAGLNRKPVVAGRTDKGVSARMQVLSGRVEQDLAPEALPALLNAHLPDDLRVHLAREVRKGFHAAWSASAKEYRYHLSSSELGDEALLAAAASLIPGTRDFRVFHYKSSAHIPRTVTHAELVPAADGVVLRLRGEGFGRYMVRMLAGGLTAVARGEIALDTFRAGLEAQTNFHCPTAPPEPLTLWEVGYPAAVDPFTAEERQAFPWG
jgi:tRNA pseudouridine38-40 synthase